MNDFRGQEIKKGDVVVYATHQGAETRLTELEVTEVTPKGLKGIRIPIRMNDRVVTLKNMHTVVKI